MSDLNSVQTLVVRDFELQMQADEVLTEAELLELLAQQIAYLIDHKLEFLLSLMYRLDIDENLVNAALSPLAIESPALSLARLVLERQKQRVFTKQHYKQQNPNNWNWEE